MRNRIVAGLLMSATVGVLTTGCGSDDGVSTADASAVEGVRWVLDDLDGESVPEGVEVTMRYDGERVDGNGGCNQYSGTATFDDGAVDVVDELVVTLMACDGPAGEVESRYLSALTEATTFAVEDDRLVMRSDGDDAVLVLSPTA